MSYKLNSKSIFLLVALLSAALLLGGITLFTRAASENTQPPPLLWMAAAPIPEAMGTSKAQCTDDPNGFYLVGGATNPDTPSTNTNSVYRYYATTNIWESLAPMPVALRAHATTCYEGKIYAAGGWDTVHFQSSFYIYDIATDTWSSGATLLRTVWGAALGAWDGKVYLVGGTNLGYPYTPVPEVDVYDIATNTWTVQFGSSMPVASGFAGYVQAGPYLYLVGGISGDLNNNVTATQRFDMRTQIWEQGPTFISGRALMGLAVTEHYLYALGGDPNGDGSAFNQTDLVERLDHTQWPGGAWEVSTPVLPFAVEGNAGFCTEAMAGGEVWSTGGGYDVGPNLVITDTNLYQAAEPCFSLYGLALTPETAALEGYPGETVTYTLQLTNTGFVTDTYDLAVKAVWTTTVPVTIGPLGPGETLSFSVVVTVPPDATFFDADTAHLTATSQGDPGEYATASLTTSVPAYWASGTPPSLLTAASARAQCDDDPNGFYILGGLDSFPAGDTDRVFHYDATTDTWDELAPMPEALRVSAAVCYDGKIYDAGGFNYSSSVHNTFFIYDIATDTWQSATLPRYVWGAAIGAWDGKLYLAGGTSTGSTPWPPVSTVNVYDIATGMWEPGPTMPVAAMAPGYVQAGPYLYVAGGISGDLYNNVTATQRFDMRTQTWTMGPEFTSARALFGLAITGQYLYAIAGDPTGDGTGFGTTDLVEALDYTQWPGGVWEEQYSPFPLALEGNVAFCTEAVIGGEIWSVGGGDLSNTPNDNVFYHPAESCFTLSYGLTLTPEADTQTALPGATVTYTLQVTNTGSVGDTYTVTVDAAWATDAPLSLGPLDPGAAETFEVTVTVPNDALAGEMDIATVTLTSQGDSLQTASAVLVTTALPTNGVSLAPSASGTGYVGETIPYTLQLTNLGNITDTFALAATGNVWNVTLPFTETILAPGEVLTLTVTVTIPADAADGAADSVTVSATSTSEPAQTASAILITTTLWHSNFLPVIIR